MSCQPGDGWDWSTPGESCVDHFCKEYPNNNKRIMLQLQVTSRSRSRRKEDSLRRRITHFIRMTPEKRLVKEFI
ncbi:hypothetical protein Bpfe_000148 [Biomphalaria pfeifferi]|uniref:Uncharacterized protein n=1 Tax=Biomphalaria pfeifferi TaxID=112525 RepID=A0AAD8CBY6_BIOPF|nr:hypothetical protein Bpfe_000148 [Biomphalaria pfeifferi]